MEHLWDQLKCRIARFSHCLSQDSTARKCYFDFVISPNPSDFRLSLGVVVVVVPPGIHPLRRAGGRTDGGEGGDRISAVYLVMGIRSGRRDPIYAKPDRGAAAGGREGIPRSLSKKYVGCSRYRFKLYSFSCFISMKGIYIDDPWVTIHYAKVTFGAAIRSRLRNLVPKKAINSGLFARAR